LAKPRRRRKKASASHDATSLPPYITRTAPVYDILNAEQVTAVEEAAEDILERVGVDTRHEPSLKLLRDAGCKVDGERVRFERGFCRKLVMGNAPFEFIQHARNPEQSVKIGGDALGKKDKTPLYAAIDGNAAAVTAVADGWWVKKGC
jgi:trimethylamine---corrinoid protein Co-methyltransferase